ncbi:MAG: NAD-dependent epimerase/dehydratase family protein [Nocardioidaceae bacterium]
MRILFIGGTRFVGRAMAEAALSRGHDVTLLHRGVTNDPVFDRVEHLRADRDQDLSILHGREFEATIDVCAYVPRQVTSLAKALNGRGGHQVFVSTMSVYADADKPGLGESAPLVQLPDAGTEEVTSETYGGLKALCEKAAGSAYDDDLLTIIRPTYVVGPNDHTGRFTWWVRRIAHGGEVLAPGPYDAPMQVIDARDQAEWTISLAENATCGTFNSVSPTPPFGFGQLLDAAVRAVGPHDTTLTWADAGWLTEHGETYQSMPLWTEGKPEWTLAADSTAALSSGLAPRPLSETIADIWEWIKQDQPPLVTGWGISAERETTLLAAWKRQT